MPLNRSILCPVLVGRTPYLDALNQAIARVRDGQGQIVVLTGEAGIGKSRLVSEVKTITGDQGFRQLQGNCFESDRILPYAPLLDLIQTFIATRPSGTAAAALRPFASDLIKLLPELHTLLPDIAASFPLEAEQEKRRHFQTLTQFLTRPAPDESWAEGEGRRLLILEDLHWSDDTSLEFLLSFAHRIASQPLMLLLTYREDQAHPALQHFLAELNRTRLATELRLSHLSLAQVETMIRAIFAQEQPVRAEFAEAMHALTDGNPFFVEEVLKSLVAAGGIYYEAGMWTRKPMSELHIPATLQDAVGRRIVQLSQAARNVLTLAAVAGRRFDFTLLQDLTGQAENELLECIKELIAAQLVVEESADCFAFRHALTRQAIYSGLLARERRRLHQQIAETLERLYLDEAQRAPHLADLAYHFYEASDWAKALTYSQQAGEIGQSLHAPRVAVEHFTRAIEAAHHVNLRAGLGSLHRARGLAHETLGQFEAARADYEVALEAAGADGDRLAEWQALLDLGFLWTARDNARTSTYLNQALALARELGDLPMLAHSLNRMGNWHLNTERPLEARRYHKEALGIFQQLNDQRGLAATLDLLGITSYIGGDLIQGTAYYEHANALYRVLDNRQGVAATLTNRVMGSGNPAFDTTVWPVEDFAARLRSGEEALAITRAIGWRPGEANALLMVGLALGLRGEYGEALSRLHTSLEIASELGHAWWQGIVHYILGALYLDLFAWPLAKTHLEQSLLGTQAGSWSMQARYAVGYLVLLQVAQNEPAQAEAAFQRLPPLDVSLESQPQRHLWCARAELYLAQGQTEAALQIIDRLIASAPNVESQGEGCIPRLWKLRGETLAALRRPAEALAALRAAHQGAQARGLRPMMWRIHLSLGKLYHAQRRFDEAEGEWQSARALVEELTIAIPDQELRTRFQEHARARIPSLTVSPRRAAKRAFSGLTERERQVAALVAQGKSNREIAKVLVIAEPTAKTHVASILSKLGLTSRAQIASWAIEQELVKHR